MKNVLFSLAACLVVSFTPAQARFNGWGYLDSFPWVYLDDEDSWTYLFVVEDNYWAYVMETGEYWYVGEVSDGGEAPGSVEGIQLRLQVVEEGELGEANLSFAPENVVEILVDFGGSYVTLTGEYQYMRQGANTAQLLIVVEDEEDVIDSLFYLSFGEDGSGYYMSLSSDEEELPVAGEDGQYGQFIIVPTVDIN